MTQGNAGKNGNSYIVSSFSGLWALLCPGVTCCLGVRLDPGIGCGVGVPESRVGWDGASVSGSLRRLEFRVQHLAMGRGRVAGCDDKTVDSNRGDAHEQESRCGG